jgi:hypothetical protein
MSSCVLLVAPSSETVILKYSIKKFINLDSYLLSGKSVTYLEKGGITMTSMKFKGNIAAFPIDAANFKKAIYAVTTDGRLAQLWDTNGWNVNFPAELAGYSGTFNGNVAVFPTDETNFKKALYAITSDGKLMQMWDVWGGWNRDFPAQLAGYTGTFKGGIAVFPTNVPNLKKAIYVVTNNGKLAQIWDTNKWNISFPAELAGYAGKFIGGVAAFSTDETNFKKALYAVTEDRRLTQIWDTSSWNISFPGGILEYQEAFKGGIAAFPLDETNFKKALYAVTTDGRLAQLWDTNGWNMNFPTELGGYENRFIRGVAAFATDAGEFKKALYAVTDDGRLTQIWDTRKWNISFPAESAGYTGTFKGGITVFPTDENNFKKAIYALTTDGRLAQIWDTTQWNISFPAESV